MLWVWLLRQLITFRCAYLATSLAFYYATYEHATYLMQRVWLLRQLTFWCAYLATSLAFYYATNQHATYLMQRVWLLRQLTFWCAYLATSLAFYYATNQHATYLMQRVWLLRQLTFWCACWPHLVSFFFECIIRYAHPCSKRNASACNVHCFHPSRNNSLRQQIKTRGLLWLRELFC